MAGRKSKFRLTRDELFSYAFDTNQRNGVCGAGQGSVLASPKGSRLSGRYEIHSPRPGLAVLAFDLQVGRETELLGQSEVSCVGFVIALNGSSRWSVVGSAGPTEEVALEEGTSLSGSCRAEAGRLNLAEGSRHRLVRVQCSRTFLRSLLEEYGEVVPEHLRPVLSSSGPARAMARSRLSPALQCIGSQLLGCPLHGASRRLFFEAKALELIALILGDSDRSGPVAGLNCDDGTTERLYHARRILDLEFVEPPSLESLARRCGLNEFKLKRGFRDLFQTTVYGYIRSRRMERARILLEAGKLNVTETALESGYSALGHFAARFKEQFGVLPNEYRSGKRSFFHADSDFKTE